MAAQVHADTIAAAVKPVLMILPAVLNPSELCMLPRYFSSILISADMIPAKTIPRPTTINQPTDSSKTSPSTNSPSMAPAASAL